MQNIKSQRRYCTSNISKKSWYSFHWRFDGCMIAICSDEWTLMDEDHKCNASLTIAPAEYARAFVDYCPRNTEASCVSESVEYVFLSYSGTADVSCDKRFVLPFELNLELQNFDHSKECLRYMVPSSFRTFIIVPHHS